MIGLYNLEPKIENTAMMQVSRYHKDRGDSVEHYWHLAHERYDAVYAFSIFDFSTKAFVRKDMICGGTGFDVRSRLPEEIERAELDYAIFPRCTTSYLWFSRGCIRQCPFCVVREKEGYIKAVEPKLLNQNGDTVTVMDNNFFANPEWPYAIERLVSIGLPTNICQGIDIRLFTDDHGEALAKLRRSGQLHIAWDNPREDISKNLLALTRFVPRHDIMCYVLIGFWSTEEEDLYRIRRLRELGVDPFVMPYDRNDNYQRRFARWVNHKAVFNTVSWENYAPRCKNA